MIMIHAAHLNRCMMKNYRMIKLVLVALFSLMPSLSYAQDIHELQRNKGVSIQAWVGEKPGSSTQKLRPKFSVNQQVILSIEVSTPRWFTGGTRIGSVDVPHLIAKQRNQLATNFTERKGGQTWSHQRWEVTLYPQTSGDFVIPPIAVNLQVSAADGAKVSGTLYTPLIKFQASIPSGLLSNDSQWFAATNVKVKQEWQTSSDDLKVGDAITRTLTINADDSLSVLLPNLLNNQSTSYYQTYPQPHRLDDKQARGNYQSSRIEESVYVIQQGGDIRLPERQFQWWNTQTKQLETVTIEGKSFTARHTFKSFVKAHAVWIILVMGFIALVVILFIVIKRYYQTHPTPAWFVFYRLICAKRWPEARAALYKQGRIRTMELEMSKMGCTETWKKQAHRFQNGEENAHLMRSMWRFIQSKKRQYKMAIPKALPRLDKGTQNRKKDDYS